MELTHERFDLKVIDPFRIARGTTTVSPSLIVKIGEGFGEAAPSSFYGEDVDTVVGFVERARALLGEDPFKLEEILERVDSLTAGNGSAKAAIDMALYDQVGKLLGIPVYKLLGLSEPDTAYTSFTIAIDTPETMKKKTEKAPGFSVYKVKVGVPGDEEMVAAVRQTTSAKIRVDANCGWKPKEAVERISSLSKYDLEYIEQPVERDDTEGLRYVREHVDLPIIADEGVMTSQDVVRHYQAVDGVNIKLSKCGGIREALRTIHTARALGMKVMLGCMIETSVGISAAMQLASLADYLDLDGHLLIENDPFEGLGLKEGRVVLSGEPGLGVKRRVVS
jgi:L-alanine-DL-glutamate epimerase-like enolase superfamily enzyme